MTREEALAFYHPIRASVRRILSVAISACNQPDFMRAAKQLGLWVEGTISLPEGDQAAEMLSDIALLSRTSVGGARSMSFLPRRHDNSTPPISNWPNGWGRHSFRSFAAQHGTGSREFGSGPVDRNQTLWLMDEGMDASAPTEALLACAFSTPANFMLGLGSSCRRMRRQRNSASKASREMAAHHSGIRSQRRCMPTAFAAARRFPRSWKTPSCPRWRS